jgi:uncharacterized membrane protein (DUF2068 family)
METRSRPLGVTILSILAGINGIIGIILGIIASLIIPPAGVIGIVIGLAWFVLAWGLWTAKGWAWIITVIIAIISIIFNLFGAVTGHIEQIISLIIAAVMLYYLTRPNVKAYFGRRTKIST